MTTKQFGELPKAYEPHMVEGKWYDFWMEQGYFTPKIDPSRKPFVIIMPPPNVTGELHLGHALTAALEDAMVRWHRMRGEPALWLPGIDHAGIAAQVVVEKELAKEGLTRQELGREKFLKRMGEWMHKYGHIIARQHRRLGASCDWTRERFTLDEGPSLAVRTTFVNLYKKGLIYRGERIINWCPRCATALSDLEVEHKELQGNLYYVRYPLVGEDGFITVATTRPETILGDTAVAVNPADERFRNLRGKKARLPAVHREIPIIQDDAVDPKFGTGAVKITPSHDPVDFEVAGRHNLPFVNILNSDATMNENAGPYKGQDRYACRKAILKDLEKDGLLVKVEPYKHSVGHCQRCQTVIEPITSQQWFVEIAPLAKPAIQAVVDGRIKIIPERFTKVYLNWMENIRDWCISRQLWWGHRIPVWYCADCSQLTVAVEKPDKCSHCSSPRLTQDPDVLDTWFSSALWTHSTLGWHQKAEDFRYFYPTTVMETGYDILFFWVARMIMMGLENTGEVPFRYVYLHGLIRDEKGEKMSKLKGNVLNPLDALEKYGTDALRFALTTGSSPGNDIRLSWQKLEAARNFANKLYNATRFVMRSLEGNEAELKKAPAIKLPVEDRWLLSRLNRLIAEVNGLMEEFQFGEAEREIHDFLWGEFCDWYIEIAKLRLSSQKSPSPLPLLVEGLETSLRLLHPFMPFVTEELWQTLVQRLPQEERPPSIMIAPYPVADPQALDGEAEGEMERVIEIVRSIRNARAQSRVEASRWIEAHLYADEVLPSIEPHRESIEVLARVRPLALIKSRRQSTPAKKELVLLLKDVEVVLPLAGMVDIDAERQRLEKELELCKSEIARLRSKLGDADFLSKAPPEVVAREQARLGENQDKLSRLEKELARLEEGGQ